MPKAREGYILKKYLGGVNGAIKENKGIFLCILLFFLIGLVLGSYTVFYMSEVDKKELSSYYTNFIGVLKNNPINYAGIIWDSIKNNLIFIVIIILLGFTIIGTPFILIMDLIKGYIIGFTFSMLVAIMGNKGILMAFIALVPQNIVFIICVFVSSIIALKYSIIRLKTKVSQKADISSKFSKEYINSYIFIIIMLVFGILIETYISPNLIRLVITKMIS